MSTRLITAVRALGIILVLPFAFLLSGCASVRPPATAVSAGQPAPWRLDVNTSTLPRYLGSNGGIFHKSTVQHTAIFLTHTRTGIYGKVFLSVPIGGEAVETPTTTPNYGNETDVALGWNGKAHRLQLNGEVSMVDVTPFGQYRGNVFQVQGTASHDFQVSDHQSVGPYSTGKFFVPATGLQPPGGFFLHNGVSYAWSPWPSPSLSGFAELVYDSGVFGFQSGYLGRTRAVLTWNVKNHVRVQAPLVEFITPLSKMTDGRKSELMVSGGVAVGW